MIDSRDLARRYLEQQAAVGPSRVVLPEPQAVRQPKAPAGPSAPKAPRPTAKAPTGDLVPGLSVEPPPANLFSTESSQLAESLTEIGDLVRDCTKCELCKSRTNAVPGEGPADAQLVVVGEGPGKTEDATGRPFVGKAGELLTKILAAIDLARDEVFICNVVKCRPPSNRVPLEDEIQACLPYLHRQIELINPKVILAMGGTAATSLLQTKSPLSQLRGKVHRYRNVPVIVTYHPAALLRNPNWKRPTWDDVRLARKLLDG